MKLDKYKENLRVLGDDVYSYETKVAHIDWVKRELHQLGYWSVTTQKNINYVARHYDIEPTDIKEQNVMQRGKDIVMADIGIWYLPGMNTEEDY